MSPEFRNNVTFVYIPFLLILLFLIVVAKLLESPVQASVETTDFATEKSKNSAECPTTLSKPENLLDGSQLRPGDLIQFQRDFGFTDHWGVYVGRGDVIHLVGNGERGTDVLKQPLVDIGHGRLCRVNNLEAPAKRRKLTLRNRCDIVRRAETIMREFKKNPRRIDYDLTEFNCEHFATTCAYGIGFSEQAENAKSKEKIRSIAKKINAFVRSYYERWRDYEMLTDLFDLICLIWAFIIVFIIYIIYIKCRY